MSKKYDKPKIVIENDESIETTTEKLHIRGVVVGPITGVEKKLFKVDDTRKLYLCEADFSQFIDIGDYLSFDAEFSRRPTRGAHANKIIYTVPTSLEKCVIEIPDDDDYVYKCILRCYHSNQSASDNNYDKVCDEAEEEGLTVIEYMHSMSEEYSTASNRSKFFGWWFKNNHQRRLWQFGLKTKEIDHYKEVLRCTSYELLKKMLSAPLQVYCMDLDLAINICKSRKIAYDDVDIAVARIARFINDVSNSMKHVCLNKKSIMGKYPDFPKYEKQLLREYDIVKHYGNYYIKYNWIVTSGLAEELSGLLRRKISTHITPTFTGITKLDDTQKNAVELALNSCISIITGGAGCGKTTIIREIVHNLNKRGVKEVLSAFTGKAVVCIRNSLIKGSTRDDTKAKVRDRTMTLHMLMKKKDLLNVEHLIIDEGSMIYHSLLYEVLRAFPMLRSLTIIGDHNQLPPVKWGNTMKSLMSLPD
jgi:hypothetical protein